MRAPSIRLIATGAALSVGLTASALVTIPTAQAASDDSTFSLTAVKTLDDAVLGIFGETGDPATLASCSVGGKPVDIETLDFTDGNSDTADKSVSRIGTGVSASPGDRVSCTANISTSDTPKYDVVLSGGGKDAIVKKSYDDALLSDADKAPEMGSPLKGAKTDEEEVRDRFEGITKAYLAADEGQVSVGEDSDEQKVEIKDEAPSSTKAERPVNVAPATPKPDRTASTAPKSKSSPPAKPKPKPKAREESRVKEEPTHKRAQKPRPSSRNRQAPSRPAVPSLKPEVNAPKLNTRTPQKPGSTPPTSASTILDNDVVDLESPTDMLADTTTGSGGGDSPTAPSDDAIESASEKSEDGGFPWMLILGTLVVLGAIGAGVASWFKKRNESLGPDEEELEGEEDEFADDGDDTGQGSVFGEDDDDQSVPMNPPPPSGLGDVVVPRSSNPIESAFGEDSDSELPPPPPTRYGNQPSAGGSDTYGLVTGEPDDDLEL